MGFRVPEQLATIIDFIRWGASRFAAAGLSFGHSYDNALDEATQLVLHALHLPHDLAPAYGAARLSAEERVQVMHLFKRRIDERKPACYLTGEAWFAGLAFKVDERVLVPRSPIAELIEAGFEPWLGGREVRRALDLCTGSGCIGIAMAAHQPGWHVDVADISAGALALARENVAAHHLQRRMRVIESDLYGALGGERYDLIVSNPPYVPDRDVAALPPEYGHEPALGLKGGDDGLDLVLRILAHAPEHLGEGGLLVVEVGDSEEALAALLPQVPFAWVEFKVGQMGVFVLGRDKVLAHQYAIRAELGRRGLA
ncbi:MAG: 50S ribosomal protein L3 N(5)-glutamine methyltransferase [Xanthomonadales bacterium]|nr:50S ribosomal protein L3 N(5)-glutamine methyltransferase [Xanthomonadales bacterium]